MMIMIIIMMPLSYSSRQYQYQGNQYRGLGGWMRNDGMFKTEKKAI
jgi:hypothetical protein